MGSRKFQQLRLALFANSYCGKHLAIILKGMYRTDKTTALGEIALLAKALNFQRRMLFKMIIEGKCYKKYIHPNFFLFPRDLTEIPIFLAVEKEMVNISENRFIENLLEVEDYHGAVLQLAVERAAGNKLSKIVEDSEFDNKLSELCKVYLRCYYRIAYQYKLPTMRILPFLLRLIS